MPAKSKAQQIAAAIAKHNPGKLYKRNRGLLGLSDKQKTEYAQTARKGLKAKASKGK